MSFRKIELEEKMTEVLNNDEIKNEKINANKSQSVDNSIINQNLIKIVEDIVLKTLEKYGYKRTIVADKSIINNPIKNSVINKVNLKTPKIKKRPKVSNKINISKNKTKNKINSNINWVYLK